MTGITPLNRKLRNVRRGTEILSVLIKHGFKDFVHELRLDELLERGKRILGAQTLDDVSSLPRAVRLRRAMEELGPTFIKLGQILSTRPDLIPTEWAAEFAKLQDDCPQISYRAIRECLEEEFGGQFHQLFESVEETALAAASVAQIHRARLSNGAAVVLKILRPGVREKLAADLEVLETLAHILEAHFKDLGYSPSEVVRVFAGRIQNECDFLIEAEATDRLRQFFDDDPHISFPKVHWETTTQNILALDEVKGELLSRIDIANLSDTQRKKLVERGASAVFRQCFELGFFHADPHPGNIFVLPGEHLSFIDCGLTGHLDDRTSGQLADLVHGVTTRDVDRVIQAVTALADIPSPVAESRAFRSDVWGLMSRFDAGSLDRLDIVTLLKELFEKLRAYRIRCPADLVFLIKALSTIEAVGQRLAPSFDIVAHAAPYIENLVMRRYGFRALRKRIRTSLLGYAELAEVLPGELQRLLEQLRRSRFSLHLEHTGLEQLRETISYAIRTVSFALVISALLVASSILLLASGGSAGGGILWWTGIAGSAAATLLAGALCISNLSHRS